MFHILHINRRTLQHYIKMLVVIFGLIPGLATHSLLAQEAPNDNQEGNDNQEEIATDKSLNGLEESDGIEADQNTLGNAVRTFDQLLYDNNGQAPVTVRQVPDNQMQVQLSYAPLVKMTAPAVVNIYTKKVVRQRRSSMFDDPLFKRFFGDNFSFGMPQDRVRGSLGSGVIVRSQGIIVTNNHVIESADEITVVLSDRREYDAEIVLADPRTDIAILKINTGGEQLTALKLADSDGVEVGDIVLAIGNPFGIGQTVTGGIVSAAARTQQGISDFGFFIQTDAAVNPGNSGGALIGMKGDLLGINTAIYSRTGTSNGIGFAVPANMVASVIRAALDEGQIARPWLGIKGQSVTNDLAISLGLDRPGGVLVDDVYPDSPAANAGVTLGDVIMVVNGKEIIDQPSLNFRIATLESGASITLGILKGSDLLELSTNLTLAPESPARNVSILEGGHPFQGVTIANLNPRFNDEIQVDTFLKGVVVLKVAKRTAAGRYQFLRSGDIIHKINDNPVRNVADMISILDSNSSAEQYIYEFKRRGSVQRCIIVPNRSYRCQQIG